MAGASSAAISKGPFLILGCGSIGKRHIGNLRRLGAEKIFAFDIREDRRQEAAGQFGVEVFSHLETAFQRGIQAAFICTPSHLHVKQALEAAKAGCHLFIEKPLAASMDGVDELISEVRKRRVVGMVGCNFRFHPGLQRVKALMSEGAIGKILSARAEFGQYLPDWHPWEDYRSGYSAQRKLGGGVVLDRIHEIDYLRWLLGDAVAVCAMTGHLSELEIDSEDNAEIIIRFRSGTVGSVHLDYVRRAHECSLSLTGEGGMILWSYTDHSVRWYLAKEHAWHAMRWPHYDGNTMYLDELRHFLKALEGEESPEQSLEDAKAALAIALAAKRASAEERTVLL